MSRTAVICATLALMFAAAPAVAGDAGVTHWFRCAFSGTSCLPLVSSQAKTTATATSTTTSTGSSKPKPTTTDPVIKNK